MIPYKFLRAVLLFVSPIFLLAQTSKKDFSKLSYDKLSDLYFENIGNPKQQMVYTNAYMSKAKKENNAIRKANAFYQIALQYYKTDKYKAIQYLDSVIKYSNGTTDKFFPSAAYCEKADFLKSQFKFKEAMNNYKLAEKAALQTNIDYYYVVREYIAITKSEDLGEYNDALEIYKECYKYYKSKDTRSSKYAGDYQSIIFGLADCYKSLNNADSTSYYNKLGYKESQITKNEPYKYLFILNEGANNVLKKDYNTAVDSIKKALPKMIEFDNIGNVLAAYYYLGKSYSGLEQKTKAVEYFVKVDSIYKITKEISTEFIDGYPYLIKYYKDTGDKEKQLKYITAYVSIDSILEKKYRELNKLVYKEYDTPRILSDKEHLISSLKNDKVNTYWGLSFLLLTTISIGGFALYQYHSKKQYRSRFEKIIQKTNINDNPVTDKISDSEKIADIGIAEEVVNLILEKLDDFEKDKGFLESNITVQILSTSFETNTKYISKIVNIYKEKSFTQYINDLRVEYSIVQLRKDKKLRKYTVQALALEFGFNNAESFSAAFYKKTGIKPTYFIKELDLENQHN